MIKPLYALAALFVALGCLLALELWPETAGEEPLVPQSNREPAAVSAAPVPSLDTAMLNSVTETILQRPLFSQNRHPAPPAAEAVTIAIAETVPRLTGVIFGPAGGRAIFEIAPGLTKSAAEGDNLGRFKVVAIKPGQVSISAAEGERVLRPSLTKPADSPGAGPPR